jgi:hypothetical protein
LSPRFANVYFTHDDPDRVRTTIPGTLPTGTALGCRATWAALRGPERRTDHLPADNDEQAQQAVATDPFIREGSSGALAQAVDARVKSVRRPP